MFLLPFKKRLLWLSVVILILMSPSAWGLDLQLPERTFQGDMVIGRVTPGARLWVNGEPHAVGSQGYFVVGFHRNLKRNLLVRARKDGDEISRTIRTLKYEWNVQHIKGLPNNYVHPGKEEQLQMQIDAGKIKDVRRTPPYIMPLFHKKGFIIPVAGRISGVFGSQRILNGEPRNPHSGVDIASPTGTAVHSPTDGIVRLVVKDTFLMGNVLMIDHGMGVTSIFIHLNSVAVAEGDLVRQEEIVARVGQTGRATGPHLHWGVSVGSTAVDPLRLIGVNFSKPSETR